MKLYTSGYITLALLLHAGLPAAGYTAIPRAIPVISLVAYKIYIQGGSVTQGVNVFDGPASNDLLILPVDQPFSLSSPPWAAGSGTTLPNSPSLTEHCAGIGGYNNSLMYIVGGYYTQGTTKADTNYVWSYDTVNNVFSTPLQIAGSPPGPVDSGTVATRLTDGSLWMFGGENQPDNAPVIYNTTWRLTTYPGLAWTSIGAAAPNGGRQAHSASMLSDGRMVILGGWNPAGTIIQMSVVDVFDTNAATWTTYTALLQNASPVARGSQVAVVTHDNKVIIHGGDTDLTVPLGDIAVLDMTQTSLQWTVPATTGTPPAPRFSHAGTMVGSVMMLFFGLISNVTLDNGVFALDTATWTWLTTYTPDNLQYTETWRLPPNNTVTSNTQTQSYNLPSTVQDSNITPTSTSVSSGSASVPLGPIIGGTAGGLVLIAFGFAAFLFCNRKSKRRQDSLDPNFVPPAQHYPAQRADLAGPQQPQYRQNTQQSQQSQYPQNIQQYPQNIQQSQYLQNVQQSQYPQNMQPQYMQPQFIPNMQQPPTPPLHQAELPPYPSPRSKELNQDYHKPPPQARWYPDVLPLRPLSSTSGTDIDYKPDDADERNPANQHKPDSIFR